MGLSQNKTGLSHSEMLSIANDEVDFIRHELLTGIISPPSCWKVPQIVLSGERLLQTLVIGNEPRRRRQGENNCYEEEPDAVVAELSMVNLDNPKKMVQPLQGKYTTDNVIYLYYNVILDKAKEEGICFERYLRQVVAHEIFHSIHFAYNKLYYFKGCCRGSWPMAEAFAVDYWRGKGLRRSKVLAVREGLARIFEICWCIGRNYLDQGIKLEKYLQELRTKEPKNPYCKGLNMLERYESTEQGKDPHVFVENLAFGVLMCAEISAVYNSGVACIKQENGWYEAYNELKEGRGKHKGPDLEELVQGWKNIALV